MEGTRRVSTKRRPHRLRLPQGRDCGDASLRLPRRKHCSRAAGATADSPMSAQEEAWKDVAEIEGLGVDQRVHCH